MKEFMIFNKKGKLVFKIKAEYFTITDDGNRFSFYIDSGAKRIGMLSSKVFAVIESENIITL